MKKALLVILKTKNDYYDLEYRVLEMKNLCSSIDIEITNYISQTLDRPDKVYYTRSGKLIEIREYIIKNDIETIIFEDELSPIQLKNISNIMNCNILDRTSVLLNIFESRANSKESALQIAIAKARYELPRIGLMQKELSRETSSGGGLHSKGRGETNQELKRRLLANKIAKYTHELNEIKKRKAEASNKRTKNEIPIVALVGYTNAGKSSTMNKIIEYTNGDSEKMVFAKDMLFATLETRTRQINYNKHKFLLTDTIGFISKLPSLLIESFRTTLEDVRNANLIINVLDISSNYYSEQYSVTRQMLEYVGALDKKMLLLLNKSDLLENQNIFIEGMESLPYSNYTNYNVDKLLDYIYEQTVPYMIELKLNIPYKEQKICHLIEEKATIYEKKYLENYVYYNISIDKKYYKELSLYDESYNVN